MTKNEKQQVAQLLQSTFQETLEMLEFKLGKAIRTLDQMPTTEEPNQKKEKENV